MPAPYRVHLLGFSEFERSALGSCFRLAATRRPAYEQVAQAADAQFLVVDADHADAVRSVASLGRVHESVFIGAEVPDGATAWMMRPIDPLHVLRELDAMVATLYPPAALPPAPPALAPQPPRPVPRRRASDAPAAPLPALPAQALLVDDSEIAARYLQTRLERLGVHSTRATSSGKAIELLAQRAYGYVFIDVELGPDSDLDGLALCQHIKRHHRVPGGAPPPVVTMVSAHHTELDRARGLMAGCDAYLGKPLDEGALMRVLAELGHLRPAPAP